MIKTVLNFLQQIKPETYIAIIAVIISMISVHVISKNSRRQIKTSKLEELFEKLVQLGRYFGKIKYLELSITDFRDPENKDIQTLGEYYKLRDQKISAEDQTKLIELISRIDVLAECYTKSRLKKEILKFNDMMYAFSDLTINGGSIYQELHWKSGLPTNEEAHKNIEELKAQIKSKISI